MSRELNFSKHNLSIDLAEVKEMFAMHLDEGCRYMVKEALEKLMLDGLYGHLEAGWNQRTESRTGYRNGFRERTLFTSFGQIGLEVPRDRAGKYKPDCLERYKRVDRAVDDGIRAMFLRGVSTRKVGEVLEALCGTGVSAGYVSKVTAGLDKLVRDFENAPTDDAVVFLFLDGLNVRVRYDLHVKKMVLLFAYGIKADGSRRFLSFRLVKSESRANYLSFLENLKARGLKGANLKMITMDGAAGLWSAIEDVYPAAPHQLCWAHKLRNVSKYCPKKYREECLKAASGIMYAKSQGLAVKMFREWKKMWQERIPKAVACLEDDFDRLTPVFEFPEEIRKIIRTTNVIERCFREVRRRLKVMGRFENSKSCKRIVVSLTEYFNAKWAKKSKRLKPIEEHFKKAA
jgi:transposase-like protein